MITITDLEKMQLRGNFSNFTWAFLEYEIDIIGGLFFYNEPPLNRITEEPRNFVFVPEYYVLLLTDEVFPSISYYNLIMRTMSVDLRVAGSCFLNERDLSRTMHLFSVFQVDVLKI